MFHPLRRKKLFVIPILCLLLSLCVSAVILHSASAATTLGAAAAQSGRVFATAASTSHLGDSQYVNTWYTEFSGFTPENEMKWDTTEPSQNNFNFSSADTLVNDAQQHNMKIRGHTLVWYSQLPNWVSSINSSNTILSVMNNHINTEMNHFKGKIWYWDVVNEAFNENGTRRADVFQNLLGNAYIEDAFRTARSADPNAKLCYNDYNIEDMNNAKSQAVYAMVADFKNRGVPIDCVGFQSHFIVGQIPSDFQATLQKFANLGVDVQITELDIRMPTPASQANLNQQATDYSNVVKACLAVSRCNDITVWGIPDKYSWVPGTFSGYGAPLLFDDNYNKKPAYNAVLTALNAASPVTPTPAVTPTPNGSGYAVNAGGTAVSSFAADAFSSGGSTYSTTATVSTSGVANAAPAAVYQTERYGNFTYTFPNLVPGTYTVRLHEAEVYWTSSGQRIFNVSLNGQQVLSNFDIYAAAGGANKAVVESFTATTDANGQISVQFTSVTDNAKVSGIEVIPSSLATPTPTAATTATPTSSPTATPTPTGPVYYHLVNRNSGLVIGVSNGSTSLGANLVQWSNNGGLDQQWSLVSAGNGYYNLVNRNSGLVMGVSSASTSAGATLVQWSNNGSFDQQWSLVSAGNGYYNLVNRNSGLVMGVSSASTSAGANIVQWSSIRVTRPGGVIRITEPHIKHQNKGPIGIPAIGQLHTILTSALYHSGHLFQEDTTGLTAHLAPLLARFGCQEVQTKAYALEVRAHTPEWQNYYDNARHVLQGSRAFLTKWGCFQGDFDALAQQVVEEMLRPD